MNKRFEIWKARMKQYKEEEEAQRGRRIKENEKQLKLFTEMDEMAEDIRTISRKIHEGQTIEKMNTMQIKALLEVNEKEKLILLKKIDYLIQKIRYTQLRNDNLNIRLIIQTKNYIEEKKKMQKIINVIKIIGYVISLILPLLDGVKGVTSKVTEIYRNGSN